MIAPKDESRDLVMNWLDLEGLSKHASLSARSDSVIVEASISQVEKLLNAEYDAFGRSPSLCLLIAILFSTTILWCLAK
jgi:tripeptidyl-peptidase-1